MPEVKMTKRKSKTTTSRSSTGGTPKQLVDNPTRQLDAAQRLFREGRRVESLELFHDAIRHDPSNVRAYVMTARAYAEQFQFERMESLFEELVRIGANHPGVHHYIGEIYGVLKLPAKARTSYERAANLPGAGAPTWLELASLCEQSHDLQGAGNFIERTIHSGYDVPLVHLVQAKIQRRRQEHDQAESTLRNMIAKYPKAPQWVCQAWGDLALMKDQQGDYEGAIHAIEKCKRLQRQNEAPLAKVSERSHRRLQQLVDQISSEHFTDWNRQTAELPQSRVALLTGFPRSGTTLLEQVLDAHPDVVSSEERDFIGKELFSQVTQRQGSKSLLDILQDLTPQQIAAQRERYLPVMEYLLGEPIGGRMHIDKNPAYNLTIPLLLRFFPETRLIVAVRDPRDVVLSCFLRYLPLNSVSVQFLSPESTAKRYALDMGAWLTFRDQIPQLWSEIRYEDVVQDLETQARRATKTLGVDWSEDVLSYRSRLGATKQVSSPTYEAVAQPISSKSVGRWRNYQQHLEPTFETLEQFLEAFGYG